MSIKFLLFIAILIISFIISSIICLYDKDFDTQNAFIKFYTIFRLAVLFVVLGCTAILPFV